MSEQLRLFPRPRPLVDRFGASFFRTIPKAPGVYFMHGGGRLLYVGKASNLRQRLGSYRYVTDRTSRKTVRLLHLVEAITWETACSEPAACLRENALLRTHRPRFNRMNTYPQAYPFFQLCADRGELRLRITTEGGEDCYGAFKANARAAFGALLRLIWCSLGGQDYSALPRPMLLERSPREWTFAVEAGWSDLLRSFLDGSSPAMLEQLSSRMPNGSMFHEQFRNSDLELLSHFFERGPARNRRLLQARASEGTTVLPEEVDDWPLLLKHQANETGHPQPQA